MRALVHVRQAEIKGWPQAAPAREDMVLNILGTRLMLPTEPDYDISLLPHFVKEACGTRAFRGCAGCCNVLREGVVQAGGGSGAVVNWGVVQS